MKGRLSLIAGLALLLGAWLIGTAFYSSGQLTGEAILKKVDEQQDIVMGGDLISLIRFDNSYSDGTTAYNIFGGLSKKAEGQPEKSLVYFKEPDDVHGTIFLSIKPEGQSAQLWLYLPALGMVKELVSEEERSGSFAGSTFSYRQVGERKMADDYTAELIGEEPVAIDGQARDCYLLKLTAKPEAEVDYPTGKMWVDKASWISLKAEEYSDAGNLERTMEVLKLGEFEGKTVADVMISKDLLNNNSTTISFLERRRPTEALPDELFEPQNLPNFEPSLWGF
ncbi:MAG: outer membrane lipoprotein-sorting protein [Candidatus Acetothermia bacterium]|nr:outer membrane lipoprotein-sorting protein [Candidatus Acetothermia bacterium]MDH7504568.1 outer membrane lipoprotein-sorting protein [Candidatus Acetothermia bacterium]